MSEICKVHDLQWNFITNKWSKNIKLQHAHTHTHKRAAKLQNEKEDRRRKKTKWKKSKWSPYFALQLHLRHLFRASGIKLRYSFDPPFSFCCFLFSLLLLFVLSLCRVSLFLRSLPCAGPQLFTKIMQIKCFWWKAYTKKCTSCPAEIASRDATGCGSFGKAIVVVGNHGWKKGYINVMAGEKPTHSA